MNTNHTPGPWFTTRTRGTRYVEARIDAGLQEVAACGPTEEAGQQEANARLIAAAPLLLDALEKLVRDADAEPDGEHLQGANKGCVAVNRRGIEAARAAIAAATN